MLGWVKAGLNKDYKGVNDSNNLANREGKRQTHTMLLKR